MRIVFMGSPEFAVPALRSLAQSMQVVGVITQPDRPAGRGRKTQPPAVKLEAQSLGIPVMQPDRLREPATIAQLQSWKPDAIVVAAYGKILPPSMLKIPPLGCLNIHASLLPRWRGAAPIQAAIIHGDKETGVTIMLMDEGMDTGPILAQRTTTIGGEETAGELAGRLARMGAALIVPTLEAFAAGQIQPIPQDHSLATYAPMLRKADGALEFSKPAAQLARQVRAFEPWPTSYFSWKGKRIVVRRAHAMPNGDLTPGTCTLTPEGKPAIATSQGLLVLDIVQPAGRAPMPGEAFLRGARDFPGSKVNG
jgi:methionyl-tRNA formyltransferase